jgi:hypothetical protein
MALKDFFIIDNEKKDDKPKKETVKEVVNKFPQSDSKTETETKTESANIFSSFGFNRTASADSSTAITASPEHIDKARQAYQEGLKSLKQSGYDFLDFAESLTDEDKANPSASFPMAIRFASKMDKTVSKDKLIQSADYYTGKINENYNNYVTNGNAKKEDVLNQKSNESLSLNNELGLIEEQIRALQIQLNDRKNKISSIDSKYASKLEEVDSKLLANDIAKNEVINSIESLKQGIINNVK